MLLTEEELNGRLDSLRSALALIDTQLESTVYSNQSQSQSQQQQNNTFSDLLSGREPIDRARLCSDLAYTLNCLVYVCMKLDGKQPKQHEGLLRELERVKISMEKLDRPTHRLDKSASNRFIKHALTPNDYSIDTNQAAAEQAQQFLQNILPPPASSSASSSSHCSASPSPLQPPAC